MLRKNKKSPASTRFVDETPERQQELDRNKYRRAMYRDDPVYRAQVAAQSLSSYRKKVHGTTKLSNPVRKNVGRCVRIGMRDKSRKDDVAFLTMAHMAKALCRSPDGFRRWVAEGSVPPPSLTIDGIAVYRAREAEAIVSTLADHFDNFRYYRRDHKETRLRLFAAVKVAKKERKADERG